MTIPSNREDFKQYCLTKLGEPVIEINVADRQVDDRIDEALERFYERHYESLQELYFMHTITEEEEAKGFIQLDPSFSIISNVFVPGGTSSVFDRGIFDPQFQYHQSELWNGTGIYRGRNLTMYYITRSHLSLLHRLFSPDHSFRYNKLVNKLYVNGLEAGSSIVLQAHVKLYGEETDETEMDSNFEIHNIWKNRWLQNYATELIKKQWGENLKKYGNIQVMGGITLSGKELYEEALTEMAKLEEQLSSENENPASFILVG